VHYVDEIQIDGDRAEFDRVVAKEGGLDALAVRYYEMVADMVEDLSPDVVGHLDLVRRNAGPTAELDTPHIRAAADKALEVIRRHESILDLNTAGYRKGLGGPYPAPWLVQRAHSLGIGFCFGDDSHGPAQVGAGINEAREYLLANGVPEVAVLTRENGAVVRRTREL
jgi:histidinol-phosphatase (PHP family)